MARVIALAAAHARFDAVTMIRCLLVCACGLALAAAGQPLPAIQ